jgi:hypothetical protein
LVWNEQQRSFLIDSILRGLPVPEIYVQTETSADGEERTIVVDGQQRISACIEFINGDLRLVGDEDFDEQWRNRKFAELDEALRRRFRRYELIARKLPNVDDSVLREIFRRLNQTVEALEPQELRHAAYTGPFLHLVETAAAHTMLAEMGVFSAKDYLRRRNDEFMAEVAFAIISRAYPNKKDGLDEIFLTYERHGVPTGVVEDLERRFGRVFLQLEPIAGQLRRTRFRNKSDFYSLFVFLAKEAEFLPLPVSAQEGFVQKTRDFSTRVNAIKKEEAEGRSIDSLVGDPLGIEAVKYLRAVERAASDRLNRVRREEDLRAVLTPALSAGTSNSLNASDSAWRSSVAALEVEDDDAPDEDERKHTQEMLLKDE